MKIRIRIAIIYLVITTLILLVFSLSIYFISKKHTDSIFESRLIDRLEVSEKFLLEKDQYSPEELQKLKDQFLQLLPEEQEFVLNKGEKKSPFVTDKIPNDLSQKISLNEPYFWEIQGLKGIAKEFRVKGESKIVVVIANDVYGKDFIRELKIIIIPVGLTCLLVAFLIGLFSAKRALKPIASKINKANKISEDNLELRLTVHNPNDELGQLAISFNELLDRLQEAFEREKNFIRYASHEIKNPLAVVMGEAEFLSEKPRDSKEYLEGLSVILKNTKKINYLMDNFLSLAKIQNLSPKLERFHLDEVIFPSIDNALQIHPQKNTVNFDIQENLNPSEITIEGDLSLLILAFTNIIENALKYSHPFTPVSIHLYRTQNKITVDVSNKGIGIKEEDKDKIFNPLFRGSNTAGIVGSGIGLSLARQICNLHQISIEIHRTSSENTTFSLVFNAI